MARHRARGAHAGGRAQRQCDDRHGFQVGDNILPTGRHRYIGEAHILKTFDRSAAAGAVDHADQRKAHFVRHFLRLHEFSMQCRVGCATPHGKVIGCRHHRAPVDAPPSEDEVGGRQVGQLACIIIAASPGNLTDLAKAVAVEQPPDPFACVEFPLPMLPRHLLGATHILGQSFPATDLFDFFFPAHAVSFNSTRPQATAPIAIRPVRLADAVPRAMRPHRLRRS